MPRPKSNNKRGNREGTIYQRKDGRWTAAVSIGGGVGRQKRKYLYGRTRAEVAKKLTDALKADQDGVSLPSDRLTVAVFSRDWLASVKSSIRPKTYSSYESTLRVHVIPGLGHLKLAKLTPAHLERFYGDLVAQGRAPKSIRNYHSVIHSMLDKAERWDMLSRNPAKLVDLPRQEPRELPMWSPEQAREFIVATEGTRLGSLFRLAISTAARQGELLGLSWNRVDLDAGQIEIRQALQKVDGVVTLVEPKTKRSKRTIALPSIGVDALRHQRARQAEQALRLGPAWNNEMNLVFTAEAGTPLDKDNVTKRELPKVLQVMEGTVKITFHDLRHIAASLALAQGMPIPSVSEMLGHADAATTLRVYAHAVPGAPRQVADALDTVLAG